MQKEDLHQFLEEKYWQYCQPSFMEDDPVQVPHLFTQKEDIEVSALLTAIIAWGQRSQIIKNAIDLMERMDFSPYHFVCQASHSELNSLDKFYYRTFNGSDCIFIILGLRYIYTILNGPEYMASSMKEYPKAKGFIISLRNTLRQQPHDKRSEKHLSDPLKNSSCKRLNLFLRWMVRKDHAGVDFGLWRSITPSELICPLDVHTGRVARKLGLLTIKQDSWKAADELTAKLSIFDPNDPVKYDFALFGLGMYEKF